MDISSRLFDAMVERSQTPKTRPQAAFPLALIALALRSFYFAAGRIWMHTVEVQLDPLQ